ncbi:hypothetical protein PR048_001016 [Dryococelus australis]|uniref:Uncharacterized protein n=1 Tax=Dryococelus australis TaxID=614101 RepID=A0ABQ9IG74_9NEOP|nr:hypothetical protein PR048_001016 [Dryococelus australis]
MVKKLLRRTLGKASLGYEEVSVILCELESVINSRTLTYLSEDAEVLVPLSPAMFLHGNRPIGTPDIDHLEKAFLCKQARFLQRLRENLRKIFRNEYLGLLAQQKNEQRVRKHGKSGS